jgi:hypothetical protein
MTMDTAMTYEYLIRRAFNCKQDSAIGADNGLYYSFEYKHELYEKNLYAETLGEIKKLNQRSAYEAGLETGRLVAHINNAIDHVKRTFGNQLSEEQMAVLSTCGVELLFPSKEIIKGVIDKAYQILTDLGLQVG